MEATKRKLLRTIRTALDSYDDGRERYALSEPFQLTDVIYRVKITSPSVDASIGVATFKVDGDGEIMAMPSEASLSRAITHAFQLEQGVK